MSDPISFELRLGAAVKNLAANADGPVDAARIAASAISASRRGGLWAALTSIVLPQAGGAVGHGRRLILVAAVAIVAAMAVGVALYWQRSALVGPPTTTFSPTPSPSASTAIVTPTPSTGSWAGPVRSDASAMPVLRMQGRVGGFGVTNVWVDDEDAQPGWVDLTELGWNPTGGAGRGVWWLELAAKPPLGTSLDPSATVIAHGLVIETNQDGVPDYIVGISNEAPTPGQFRVWVTHLATGITEEQVGPPYGWPVEFRHPDEVPLDEGGADAKVLSLLFLDGSGPADLDADFRYYAWASVTENGDVVGWDYAPDFGWLETGTPPEVTVQLFTASVARGETVTLSVKTDPGVGCLVELAYASGPAVAAGLVTTYADASGLITWSWEVDIGTSPGTYPLDIHCLRGATGTPILAESLELQVRDP